MERTAQVRLEPTTLHICNLCGWLYHETSYLKTCVDLSMDRPVCIECQECMLGDQNY